MTKLFNINATNIGINTRFFSNIGINTRSFSTTKPLFMPVAGVLCPCCLSQGKHVWVIPGKNCPQCGTTCGRVIAEPTLITMVTRIASISILFVLSVLLPGIIVYMYSSTSAVSSDYIDVLLSDAPRPWGLYFQDTASPQMEALVELHNNIMFYLIIILFTVGWILAAIIVKYVRPVISNKYVNHGTLVELIWTITPGLILILIAFTSFKLLYLNDEVSDINVSVYVEGHQWYWSYLFPDFLGEDGDNIEFDSYLKPESDLKKGQLRMLEVDEGVMLPEVTHTKLIISSGDVIHSYACPSLGLKTDAYPGRLNQASTLMNRLSSYFGQCSEICGILHSSMPIKLSSVPLEKFLIYLSNR